MSTRPPNNDKKQSLNFNDDSEEGFVSTGLLAGSGNRGFHLNRGGLTMMVDSGASNHLTDEELIPRRRKNMGYYKKLKELKTIVTNGNKKVFATATGTI